MPGAEFSGNYTHNIDPKGRATIPAAYREALGDNFTIGLNNDFSAIALYPAEKWQDMSAKLDRIPDTDARGRAYVRLIQAFSFTNQSLDSQGRALIPQNLREFAGFEKNVTVVGCNNHAELWDSEAWAAVFTEETKPENIAAVMEELEF